MRSQLTLVKNFGAPYSSMNSSYERITNRDLFRSISSSSGQVASIFRSWNSLNSWLRISTEMNNSWSSDVENLAFEYWWLSQIREFAILISLRKKLYCFSIKLCFSCDGWGSSSSKCCPGPVRSFLVTENARLVVTSEIRSTIKAVFEIFDWVSFLIVKVPGGSVQKRKSGIIWIQLDEFYIFNNAGYFLTGLTIVWFFEK